jgi:hypothetical protein
MRASKIANHEVSSLDSTLSAADTVEVRDMGRASKRTRGSNRPFFMEGGSPPYIYVPVGDLENLDET